MTALTGGTLAEVLASTGDGYVALDCGAWRGPGAVQVFRPTNRRRYYRLTDYAVSSACSGPSLILVPRAGREVPK